MGGESRRGGILIAAAIAAIAVVALAGFFRPQLAQAWGSVTGPSQEQEEDIRAVVERYVEAQDMAGNEFSKVKGRLEDGIVTERFWSSEQGRSFTDNSSLEDPVSGIHFAINNRLAGWSLEECCPDGTARGVATTGQDWRVYDLEEPDDSSELLDGSYKERIELVEQDGRWRVAGAQEIKDGNE